MNHRDFAETLVAWRERSDYTQKAAAELLGVSRRSLENWEQERAMPQGYGLSAMLKFIQGAKPAAAVKPKSDKKPKKGKRAKKRK